MIKLSIYIVCYNYGQYLEECLESIQTGLRRNRNEVELLIIDDNSSDNSKDIIKKYLSMFDHVIHNDQNMGLIKTCNKAISYLSGEYIMRIDADDTIEPEFIDAFLNKFYTQNAELIYPNYNLINQSGETIATYKRSKYSSDYRYNRSFHGAFTVIKYSFLEEVGFYDEDFTRQDGYYLWLMAVLRNKKILHVEEAFFNYRQHRSSLSFDKRNLFDTRYDINARYVSQFVDINDVSVLIPLEEDNLFNERLDIIKKISNFITNRIIILSAKNIEIFQNNILPTNVEIHKRKEPISHTYTEDIIDCTIRFGLKNFLILEPNYSFINPKSVRDILLISSYFDYDICYSTITEKSSFLIENKISLQPFNHTTKTRYERNELFRIAGGLKYFKNIETYIKYNRVDLDNFIIGQVEVDNLSSLSLNDLKALKNIYNYGH